MNIQNSPKLEFLRSQKRNSSLFEERFRKDSNPRRTADEIRSQVVFDKQIKTLQPQILMALSIIEESKDLNSCKELRKLLEYGLNELSELEKNINQPSAELQKSKQRWSELMTESIEKRSRSSSPKGKYSNGSPISDKYMEKLNRDEWNKTGQNYQKEQSKEKVKMAKEKQLEKLKKIQEESEMKQKKAHDNQKEHLSKVSLNAKEKTSRVNEVAFIQKINEDNEKYLLSNKIKMNEETHTQRREEKINSIKKKISVDLETKERAAKLKREELEIQRQNSIKEKEKQRKQKEELFQERRSSMFKFRSPQTPKTIPLKRKESILSLQTSKTLNFSSPPIRGSSLLDAILSSFKSLINEPIATGKSENLSNPKITRIFNDLKAGIQNEKIENCRTALREFISLPDNKKGFDIQFLIQEEIVDYLVNLLVGTIETSDPTTANLCSKVILKVTAFPEGSSYLIEKLLFFQIYNLALKSLSNGESSLNLSNLFEIVNSSLLNYDSSLKWNLIWYISESGLFDSLHQEFTVIYQLDQSQSVFVLKLLHLISQIISIIEDNKKEIKKERQILLGILENFISSSFGGIFHLLCQILNDQKKVIPHYLLSISFNSLKIMNSVFYQYSSYCDEDCSFIQKTLNSVGDLESIISVLLNYCCTHDAVTQINPSLTNLENLTDVKSLLHELILFIGYYTLNNEEGQSIFSKEPKLIKLLNDLPMFYFVTDPEILFPTLISISFRNEETKSILGEDLNFCFVREYLKECQKESKSKFSFSRRIPLDFIPEALEFFADEEL